MQSARRFLRVAPLCRARDGTTAIEMALLLPVFLLFLLGIVELGRALWTQTSLQYAVEAAARCAAVTPSSCGTASAVTAYAASKVYGLSVPSSDFSYSTSGSCGSSSNGKQVSATYTFRTVVGAMIPQLASVTLSAKSCHP